MPAGQAGNLFFGAYPDLGLKPRFLHFSFLPRPERPGLVNFESLLLLLPKGRNWYLYTPPLQCVGRGTGGEVNSILLE